MSNNNLVYCNPRSVVGHTAAVGLISGVNWLLGTADSGWIGILCSGWNVACD